MNAGFSLQSSWPVHTEPGEKFGKANKGALKVTVLLYCRKRENHRPGRWEDVVEEIRHTASYKVEEYSQNGITGPDLLVSVYGPALGKFSEYYPVKDVTGAVRGVGDALAIVAQVVNEYLTGDVQGADMETLAYLNLLRIAHGLTLEYDLARVSTVFGGNTSLDAMDVRGGSGLVKKTGSKVKILTAKQRFAEGVLDPHRPQTFGNQIDVVHAALILYEQEGLRAVSRILEETGKDTRDAGIISVLQAITTAGEGGSADLVAEARIASALLEALGQTPSGVGRSGERITHWI
jgi:adenine-specific DNA methylase